LASGFLTPNLISTGNIGTGMPKLSLGISIGVCQFLTAQAKVMTVDAGTLGVGTGLIPLIVPNPLLLNSLLSAIASANLMGVMAPKFIAGLAQGLTSGWLALAILRTNHPGIGVGTGVARVVGPTSVPAMIAGFAAVSMVGNGPVRMARAIGTALDMTFASFVQVGVPIVGSASPTGGSGVGFGTVG
jgi:hypothetical protein